MIRRAMMHYEVTASELKIRRVIPMSFEDKSSVVGKVFMGFRFEAIEVPVAQIPNPALGRWFKDKDGFFYWGEAVRKIGVSPATLNPVAFTTTAPVVGIPDTEPDAIQMSWGHELYDIPFIWNDLKTKGAGIIVAVIDSGADHQHNDLLPNIHPLSKSFVGNEEDISDSAGHGTNMAGIIAAAGVHRVFGVAPEAQLLIVKATNKANDVNLKTFAKAIDYAASIPEVNIVSISYSFLQDDPDIKSAIDKCIDAGKIVVAAVGNRRNVTKPSDDDTFPSSYNSGFPDHTGVFTIGAFDKNGALCSFSNWNKHLTFLAPGDRTVLTTGIGNTAVNGSLTSIATAFTAGSLALMMSFLKIHNPDAMLSAISAIMQTCDDMGPTTGFDIRSGYGRMNLRNAVSKIKMV